MTEFGGTFADPTQADSGPTGGTTRTGTVVLDANTMAYQRSMAGAATSTQVVNTQVTSLLGHLDNLSKFVGKTIKIVGAADIASLAGGVASAAQLEKQMGSLNATVAVNRTSIAAYGNAVDSSFSNFRGHRGDVVALVTELSSLSVKSRDIGQVTASMTKLGAATGESVPQLTQSLIQLDRQMGVMDGRTGQMANSLLTVSKNAGVSASGVLQFGNAIAPIARQAGITGPAVLGISTAFTKAGANGFVAANTFNSIVNDITTLTKTGSPELVKYASFIGKTADQFRKMPAKDQITGIFDAIAKGGPQALNFVQELGLGTRALSAVQAVAQSGGMDKYINIAQANADNTGNLNRGSAAALSGLGDAGAGIRNQLTRLITGISDPLLTPVTKLAHGLEFFLKGVNDVVQHMGALPAILGLVVAALAPVAAFALKHAGVTMALAGARMLMTSGPGAAFAAGREGGTLIGAGLARNRYAYRLGGWIGPATEGGPGVARTAITGAAMAAGAPFRWLYNSNARFLHDGSTSDPLLRSPYGPQRPSFRERNPERFRAPVEGESFRDRFIRGSYNVGAYAGTGWRLAGAKIDEKGFARAIGGEVGGVLKSVIRNDVAGARAGIATVGAVGNKAMGGLGRVGGMAAGLASKAFTLPGMLALGVGLPLLSSWSDSATKRENAAYNVEGSLNAMSKYDQALGQTSTNLAEFGHALTSAADKVTNTAGMTLAQVARITDADKARARSGYKSTDSNFDTLAKRAPGSTAAAVGYIRGLAVEHGGMDNKSLQAIKTDLIHAYGPREAAKILSAYTASPNGSVNYASLGRVASQGPAKDLLGQGFSAANSQFAMAPGRAASRAQLAAVLQLGGSTLAGTTSKSDQSNIKTLRALLAKTFGGNRNDYRGLAGADTWGDSAPDSNYTDAYRTSKAQSTLFRAIANSKEGRKYLQTAGIDYRRFQNGASVSSLLTAPFPTAAATQTAALEASLRPFGALGKFTARNSAVIAATTGGGVGDPVAQTKAVNVLVSQSSKLSGGLGNAAQKLQQMADASGGATAALLSEAAQRARTLHSYETPYMSRLGQLQDAAKTAQASARTAAMPGASNDSKKQAEADRGAYEQQKQSYNQFMISVQQASIEFGVSRKRASEDYNLQVYRSQRNFQIQMTQSEQDYEKSVFRSNQGFHIQMVQSEQDYTRQRGRTLADFYLQQKRQAQSAAESIYNPFARVQSQSVENGAMLLGNLKDQNQRIEQQRAQVAKLRKEGLSQGAIDTLKLNDPANAQQTNAIAQSVANDPGTIRQINRQIAIRQSATVRLTQSSFNEDFRNTVADFRKSLDRSAQDYAITHKRAEDQQQLALTNMAQDFATMHSRAEQMQHQSLTDMSTDFTTMTKRTGEDLTRQFTELFGNYQHNYVKTLQAINNNIGQYAPDIAKKLAAELAAANAAINLAMMPGGGGAAGSGVSSGGAAGSSGSNRNYTPGQLGLSPNGSYGSYDKNGNFHKAAGGPGPNPQYIGNPTSQAGQAFLSGGGHNGAQDPAGAQRYARSRLGAFGWGQDQMASLIQLWDHESGWSYTAQNGSSGAYGIPQAWPADKMAAAGSDWHDNGATQIDWGLGYIKSRYGSPDKAWSFWQNPGTGSLSNGHWYAKGSVFKTPQVIGVGEAGPEMVLPLNHVGQDFMSGMYDRVSTMLAQRMTTANRGMRGTGAPGGGTFSHSEDHSITYAGDIIVQAESPAEMERKLQARVAYKRLSRPARSSS